MKRTPSNNVIKGMIEDAVQNSVEKTVNGKIRAVHADITELRSELQAVKETIEPAVAFLTTTSNLHRFSKWVGLPSFVGLLALCYYFIKGL